jgi:hypothetical protein
MPQFFNLQRFALSLAALIVMAAAASTSLADPLPISTGNIASTTQIPETAGLLLLGGGLVGTAGVARRRLNNRRQK